MKISKCVEKMKWIVFLINISLFAANGYFVSGMKTSVNPPAVLKASNPI